ncbi:MAG: hypothetical protein ACYCQI_06735 [Gammaproteobacteria bacterium]
MNPRTLSTLADLTTLSEKDILLSDEIVKIITTGSIKQKKELALKMSEFKPERLFVLTENNSNDKVHISNRAIIKSFCYSNPVFNKALSDTSFMENSKSQPKQKIPDGFPNKAFTSIDKRRKFTPFTELMGALLWSEYTKYEEYFKSQQEFANQEDMNVYFSAALNLLNKACEMGEFHALFARMQIKLASLNHSNYPMIHKEIEADAMRIANYYHAFGEISAAKILLAEARAIAKLPGIKLDLEINSLDERGKKTIHSAILLEVIKAALRNFCLANLSSQFQTSTILTKALTHDKGMLYGFEEEFTNWEQAEKRVITVLEEQLYVRNAALLFKKVKIEAEEIVKKDPEYSQSNMGKF